MGSFHVPSEPSPDRPVSERTAQLAAASDMILLAHILVPDSTVLLTRVTRLQNEYGGGRSLTVG